MSLFVSRDGQYQGWLAAFLCCCAAVNDDEAPIERGRSRPSTRERSEVCNTQPLPLATFSGVPQRAITNSRTELTNGSIGALHDWKDRPETPTLAQQNIPRPFSFVKGDWPDRRRGHSREARSGHGSRPSTGSQSGFRRLDLQEGKRQSLVPLKLGPVRLSPAPGTSASPSTQLAPSLSDDRTRSESTQELLDQVAKSRQTSKETPFERCQRRSSSVPADRSFDSTGLISMPVAFENKAQFAQRPAVTRQSSFHSIDQRITERDEKPLRPRPSSDSIRVRNRHSNQSLKRHLPPSAETEVDREILELNTIIEERKAEQARRRHAGDHIPAVAPAMQVRARSETLNSIGSAFSRPATARQPPRIWTDFDRDIMPTQKPSYKRSTSQTSSRVSGWLSGLMGSSPGVTPVQEPFYKCKPPTVAASSRPHSQTSLCSSISDVDSPALTTVTTPTTKGHSRSATAESRMTPASPATTTYGQPDMDRKKEAEDQWPSLSSPTSLVGIAL